MKLLEVERILYFIKKCYGIKELLFYIVESISESISWYKTSQLKEALVNES